MGLQAAWINVQSSSYYSGNLPGVNAGQAIVFGDKGTVLEVAFKVGSGTASGFGADNKGNTYKVLF